MFNWKHFFISISLLVVALAVVSMVLPGTARIERSVVVQAPVSKVFEQVNTLRNWEAWSPWRALDPGLEVRYSGPPSGKNASYSWDSTHRKLGRGAMTITESAPPRMIESIVAFDKQGDLTSRWSFEEQNGQTTVTWSVATDLNQGSLLANVVSKWMGLFMDPLIGPVFEQGLQSLKSVCEDDGSKDPAGNDVPVQNA